MDQFLLLAQDHGGDLAIAGGGLFCIAVVVVLGILSLILWIWALIDAIQNPTLTDNERIIWILLIVLVQGIGAIAYLLVGRRGSKR